MDSKCIICSGRNFVSLFGGKLINKHQLKICSNCGMVLAFPINDLENYEDFSNYGDYLLLTDSEIKKRIKGVNKKNHALFKKIKRRYSNATVLDFGCGAGYFCKAAQEAGLNVFGVEVSEKLRSFCRNKIDFTCLVDSIDKLDLKFDVIFMFDVIEHLNPHISRDIMHKIVSHLKPNGLLIGQTPNFKSLNIRLGKDKDPVIWPPSHSCYFTMETLDMYLSSVGLEKVELYSRGLSSNCFFRKSKFEKSFLEKGINNPFYLIPVYIIIKFIFNCLSYLVQPFNLGYQIHFSYKLEE